ncbi:hypothetical protein Y032_0042g604 [Ancylostoma ceylanicum]|uniref:Uncharacterized protein n=1 Tax=Ancylostoma ceylanicum TaxID=53326 RepID=A0A016UFI0_9BILA|nr:hypothetical protein Y032_0042g604 [Ancylostoma ceylanicum]
MSLWNLETFAKVVTVNDVHIFFRRTMSPTGSGSQPAVGPKKQLHGDSLSRHRRLCHGYHEMWRDAAL